ncbi:TPA_asm: hypothetical protein [Altiarchaeum virus]|nr:MAG: hypothetical protein BWK75_01205 [Candidatus Altiarchaeales archaeon A3]DAZ85513.1 TPA_asm: hypothetical protein [Altiarchaeum virus]
MKIISEKNFVIAVTALGIWAVFSNLILNINLAHSVYIVMAVILIVILTKSIDYLFKKTT